jgi:site-specific recombinase XerD
MKEQIEAFLEHLRLNENASLHTVRAYESDLAQFVAFVAEASGRRRSAPSSAICTSAATPDRRRRASSPRFAPSAATCGVKGSS